MEVKNIQNSAPQIQSSDSTEASRTMTSKVVSGSIWNIGGQIGIMFSSLLATSFVIRLLGTELYGVWALLVLIVGYASQGDLGMGTASTRFGSAAYAENDEIKENKVIWTAFLIALVPISLVLSLLIIFSKYIVSDLMKIPEHLWSQAIPALIIISLCFGFKIASNIFNTPQMIRLRMDINASIVSGLLILQILLTPVAIWIGGGIVSASSILAFFSLLNLVMIFFASQRLLRRLKRPSFDFSLIKPLLSFGGMLVLSSAIGVILGSIEKPLLARYASVTELAHYAVASTLGNVMSVFPIAISQPLLPAFTQLYISQNIAALRSLYTRAIRGNLMWSLPMGFFLCVIAKPFFILWAGEEFGREATTPLYIIVGGLLINVFSYIPYILLQASGRAKLIFRVYIIEAVFYVILAANLAYFYGANGAAAAWSLKILVDATLFFLFVKPILGKVFEPFLKIGLWYWGAFLFVVLSATLLINYVDSMILLICLSIFVLLVYAVIIITKVFKKEEKNWFFGKINGILGKIQKQ